MAYTDEDDDRDASSDEDQDELIEDADDAQNEADPDEDVLDEDDEDDNDNEEDDQDISLEQNQPSLASEQNASNTDNRQGTMDKDPSIPPLLKLHPSIRPEALTAALYDIVPTMAAPQATSINAIAATPDMRYWFTGGSDGYVRKYDGTATVNGKTLLTVAQRHPFVDTVTKAGVLMSYWENDEPPAANAKPGDDPVLSPVYSLAVNSEAIWLLSGLESGGINLQSVRHDEGKRITTLRGHTSAVSVLTLAADEKSVLSGSWDKNIYDWDLTTGQQKRGYLGSGGQISAIEIRPASSLPVPEESGESEDVNGSTLASNNADKPKLNGLPNGVGINGDGAANINDVPRSSEGMEDAVGSSRDSLFGDTDSLFGDADGENAPSGGNFGADDDDEFSRAIASGMDQQELREQAEADTAAAQQEGGDTTMGEATQPEPATQDKPKSPSPPPTANELPHAEDIEASNINERSTQDAEATSDSTFLAAAIDGTLRVWDRRMEQPVARVPNRPGVPPWCMSVCWSPDGNFIYAGRRNGTVEEFSLHKGLKAPERTFRFPNGSGAVSAVRSMPNGRHLICASHDILRLWDLKHEEGSRHSKTPFLIVPGPPRAGVISALHLDPTCRYMLSTAGNRGWEGSNTEVLIGYEIGVTQ